MKKQFEKMQEEKQEEKQDSPHTLFQIKEENEKEEIDPQSKMCLVKNKKGSHKKVFVIPTLEEVQAYMDMLDEPLFTASYFWTYYDSRDWKIGCRKMKNWKKVLDNWVERDNSKVLRRKIYPAKKPAPQNIVTFNAYKPVNTSGAVSYEEYERMKRNGKILTAPLT
jgi:hypothetical protein